MILVEFGAPIAISTTTILMPTRAFHNVDVLRFAFVNRGPTYKVEFVVETLEDAGGSYPDMDSDVTATVVDPGRQGTITISDAHLYGSFRCYARTLLADGFPTVTGALRVVGSSPAWV